MRAAVERLLLRLLMPTYYAGYAAGVRDQRAVMAAAERDERDGRRQPYPCE